MHNLHLEQGLEHSLLMLQKSEMWHLHLFGPRKQWPHPKSWTASCQQQCGTGKLNGVPSLWLWVLMQEDSSRQPALCAGLRVGVFQPKGRWRAAGLAKLLGYEKAQQTWGIYKQAHRHPRTPWVPLQAPRDAPHPWRHQGTSAKLKAPESWRDMKAVLHSSMFLKKKHNLYYSSLHGHILCWR